MKNFNSNSDKFNAYDLLDDQYEGELKENLNKGTKEDKAEAWEARMIVWRQMCEINEATVTCPITGYDLTTEKNSRSSIANQKQLITPEVLENNKLYLNMSGYSDCEPYEVIAATKSGKTITVRAMTCTRITEMNFEVGGFSAHCTNNRAQEWKIESNPEGRTFKVRIGKHGPTSNIGRPWVSISPVKFYDYNF